MSNPSPNPYSSKPSFPTTPKVTATRKAPLFQIPVHVLVFSLMLTPVAAFYVYYDKDKKSEEELEKILANDEFYKGKVQANRERRRDFQKFFNNLKNPGSDPDAERRMAEVLKAGKSHEKRLFAVDETLYGTEEGAKKAEEMRLLAEEERKRKEEEKKERRRRKLKKNVEANNENGEGEVTKVKRKKKQKRAAEETSPVEAQHDIPSNYVAQHSLLPENRKLLAAAAATVAVVSIIFGGRPRSS